MTREEAIKILKQKFDLSCRNNLFQNAEKLDYEDALWLAITALRPVSREQVEKVWRGEWTHPHYSNDVSCADCKRRGKEAYNQLYHGVQDYYNFCPHCGAPMRDEGVQMVMERLEALHEEN